MHLVRLGVDLECCPPWPTTSRGCTHLNDGLARGYSRATLLFVGCVIANACFPQVAACIRTKDFARFLPEWIAFHYAIGVDEVSVYDDFSSTNTSEVLQPFIKAGIVRYNTHRLERYLRISVAATTDRVLRDIRLKVA